MKNFYLSMVFFVMSLGIAIQHVVAEEQDAEGIIDQQKIAEELNAPRSKGGYIILDGSNSMWGQRDGEAKITTVKRTLQDLFKNKLTDKARVGLIAYGHRREEDCKDIETLVDLTDKLDREKLRKSVEKLRPKGRTPMADAIEMAVEKLMDHGGGLGTSVFLFSDGQESCNKNPCDIAKNLKGVHSEIKISTVAFTIAQEKGKEQLRCVARVTGGSFFEAENSKQLENALDIAARDLDSQFGLVLQVEGGELLGTELKWTILAVESEKAPIVDKTYYSGSIIRDIEPGKYEIFVRGIDEKGVDADIYGSVEVNVIPGKETPAIVPPKT